MQPQIVHESEIHRQHVRLRIPIQVEVDGVRYQVDDWSLGGFAVESVLTSRQRGEHFPVKLIFPFEEFEMTMRFEARLVYGDQAHGRFGCAFLGLSRQQIEVFRYLIDAYLAGEVVSAGDILQVRARDHTAADRLHAIYDPPGEDGLWRVRLRRYGAWLAFGLAGLALLVLIGLGVAERTLTVVASDAVVEAPVVPIRAPIGGRFVSGLQAGERVPPEAVLGVVRGLDDRVVTLESPCECVLLERLALTGQHYQSGELLAVLIEADAPLLLRAQLPLEQVEALRLGDRAEIRMAGREEVRYGQIERIDLRPGRAAVRAPEVEVPGARRLAQVLVRPDRPFALEDFGALATVRFP